VLQRLRATLWAYVIASIWSGFAIAFGWLLSTWVAMVWRGEWEAATAQAFVGPFWLGMIGLFASVEVGAFALAPALPAIVVAEATRIRSPWFYGLTGALAGPSAYYLYAFWNDVGLYASRHRPHQSTVEAVVSYAGFGGILISAGLIGGLTYWRLAGRSAGEWRGSNATD
jgi:hypothetical protein